MKRISSIALLCSGCIFEDVDDRKLVGACAFVFVCLVLYSMRVIAEHYSSEPEDEEATHS